MSGGIFNRNEIYVLLSLKKNGSSLYVCSYRALNSNSVTHENIFFMRRFIVPAAIRVNMECQLCMNQTLKKCWLRLMSP